MAPGEVFGVVERKVCNDVFKNVFLSTLVGLSAATEYSARVQAMTVNGTGPSSPWRSATTFAHDLDGTETDFCALII